MATTPRAQSISEQLGEAKLKLMYCDPKDHRTVRRNLDALSRYPQLAGSPHLANAYETLEEIRGLCPIVTRQSRRDGLLRRLKANRMELAKEISGIQDTDSTRPSPNPEYEPKVINFLKQLRIVLYGFERDFATHGAGADLRYAAEPERLLTGVYSKYIAAFQVLLTQLTGVDPKEFGYYMEVIDSNNRLFDASDTGLYSNVRMRKFLGVHANLSVLGVKLMQRYGISETEVNVEEDLRRLSAQSTQQQTEQERQPPQPQETPIDLRISGVIPRDRSLILGTTPRRERSGQDRRDSRDRN